MPVLDPTAVLPLTCTRDGVCCHGHVIWVNPWEVARLAQELNHHPRTVRDRYLDCRGTRLAFDGPADHRGKPGCRLYAPGVGCTVHPGRPLTCRVYPLGRSRIAGEIGYHHPGTTLPCIELCPSVAQLPQRTVAEYLASQDIAGGEIAHDAYARVIYGLVAVAAQICSLGKDEVDRERVVAFLTACRIQTPEQRATILPEPWMDLATAPVGLDPRDPLVFAETHGRMMINGIQKAAAQIEDGLTEAAVLHLALAVHLAPTVGADLGAMSEMLAAA